MMIRTSNDTTSRRFFIRTSLLTVGSLACGCARPPRSNSETQHHELSRADSGIHSNSEELLDSSPLITDGGEQERENSGDANLELDGAETAPSSSSRPLLARYQGLEASLPWMDIGGLPTAISHQEALGQHLGLSSLYIKHDDQAGLDYGGSKARKLEHLVADALAQDARSILTFGGVGSNHALATAVHTQRLGLGCLLLLLPERPSDHAREHLLAEHRLGCEQHSAHGVDHAEIRRVLGARFDRESPYVIPAGGTSPLGNAGYVNAAFELAEQCAAGSLPVPDFLYVAMGTTGTAAGLYIGLRALGLPTRLVAVRASNRGTGNLRRITSEIESTSSFLRRLDPSFPEIEIDSDLLHIEHGFGGAGYAIPSDEGQRAMGIARRQGGIEFDPTYTGKAFAALIHDAPRLSGRSVLFWNTYDPRHISTGTVRMEDLPRAFHPYLRGARGHR